MQTVVANHLEKPEITYSPQGEGTLVRIETQTLDFLDVTEAAIQFVPGDKTELLTGDPGLKNDEAAYQILEYAGKHQFLMYMTNWPGEAGALQPEQDSVYWV